MNPGFGRFIVATLLASSVAPVPALAQTEDQDVPGQTVAPPPTAPVFVAPPPAVPDAAFRAMIDRPVAIRLQDGAVVAGRLVGVDSATVTLVVPPNGDVVTFDKRSITGLRAIEPVAPAPAAAPRAERRPSAPPRDANRHFAVLGGFLPSVAADVDYRWFYAFASLGLVIAIGQGGDQVPLGIGAGVNFHVFRDPRWKLELFAEYVPVLGDKGGYQAVGLGAGLHFTAERGFTLGFKVPFFGYTLRYGHFSDSNAVAAFYNVALVVTPLFSVGYRF